MESINESYDDSSSFGQDSLLYNRPFAYLYLSFHLKLLYSVPASYIAMIRAGSVGKKSTCEYTYWDDGVGEEVMGDDSWDYEGRKISHIYVAFDEVIMSIQFGFLENGALVLSKQHGGIEEGSNFRVLRLNQDEYVT
ncbi:jacalin lectin-like protein [Arabidopsis thaliana]|nr:jacalin lectin-like protein [Arabidopsis thaliana]AAO37182.1 hypothetical protein [Arabidopsis thaliana]AEC10316.2 jacalin lectin-like protein [Arabidopsis thaliana]|eukprot:NP_850401.5 jacalin lectin-like protein [Arabidopsis thaliana]